jgi:hypothetical protein
MQEDEAQGSLFGGDAFRPPNRRLRDSERRAFDEPADEPPRGAAAPWAPKEIDARRPGEVEAPPEEIGARAPGEVEAPPEEIGARAPGEVEAPPKEIEARPADQVEALAEDVEAPLYDRLAPPEEGVDPASVRVTRAPLAGPTLDDAVSRAWEGLVAGVPAPCPVCHGEIEPALGGSLQGYCPSCHVTLD